MFKGGYPINKYTYINLETESKLKELLYPYIKPLQRKILKSPKERLILYKYHHLSEIISLNNQKYIKEEEHISKVIYHINGYQLDSYQRLAVLSREKSSLIVAGAGSGKSLTILGKIAYLVLEKNVKPEEILCISFTNDATKNLQKNIAKNFSFNIDIYTFHKLALKILSANHIPYSIAPDDFLDISIDEFFQELSNYPYISYQVNLLLNKYNQTITSIKKTIHTFISLFKGNNYNYSDFLSIIHKNKNIFNYKNYRKNKAFLICILNVYKIYEDNLHEENLLDFNDMINKCLSVMKKGRLPFPWKYIIIDEYQDTSQTKFLMIQEIMRRRHASLLAVGDDFQSIYRFTGCDLDIFLKFTTYFPYAKIFQIINTYRNPQELINVAGTFIMKNKFQQKKKLQSPKHLKRPIIICETTDEITTLKDLIIQNQNHEIMVLGRNNNDIYHYIDKDTTELKDKMFTYENKTFRYLTIHKSKGLESEIVILINCTNSKTGIPSQLQDENVIRFVKKEKDYYPYEEERRLFYVALTRTKTKIYIISNPSKESIFIKELKKYIQKNK